MMVKGGRSVKTRSSVAERQRTRASGRRGFSFDSSRARGGGPYRQDWTRRRAHDPLREAPEQHVLHGAIAVGAHHDQVDVVRFRMLENLVMRLPYARDRVVMKTTCIQLVKALLGSPQEGVWSPSLAQR